MGHCLKPTRKNKKRRRCTRLVDVQGTIVRNANPGSNTLEFNGRIGGRLLGVGRYELTATPSAHGHPGTSETVTFTIMG
jgi:hypothetical protein